MEKLTKEQEKQVMTYGEFINIMESVIKNMLEKDDIVHQSMNDSLKLITETLVDSIKASEYNRQRDLYYLFEVLSENRLSLVNDLYNGYVEWCKDFDERYKEKCDCYSVKEEIIGWDDSNIPQKKTISRCNATKERDVCNCDGDKNKCNFYPEVNTKEK